MDLVLVEGDKTSALPKLEVYRASLESQHTTQDCVFPARLPKSPDRDTAKGRYGHAGNGVISSRTWKENMPLPHTGPPGASASAGSALIEPLRDPQGRQLDYLRLSVTDRCNLRCRYCMPTDGIPLVSHRDVLSFEELYRLTALFAGVGIRKIRLTGGEPLVRKGVLRFMARLAELPSRPEILLTTNGVLLADRLADLPAAGVRRVNLSLDSLDRDTYRHVTRRDELPRVRPLLDLIPAAGLALKINVVVIPGVNDDELPAFVELTRERDVTVRFIEPMPFVGSGERLARGITGDEIIERLRVRFELQESPNAAADVDDLYTIPGHRGRVGVIRGHSRTFCAGCSRLRLDARGRLRTCLYGATGADLGRLQREGARDDLLEQAIRTSVANRLLDGRAAERERTDRTFDSMAQIGG